MTTFDQELDQRLDRLKQANKGDTIRVDQVAEVVQALLDSVRARDGSDAALFQELEGLAEFIRHARSEIAAVKPAEIQGHHLPSAADELDAIVAATERATNTIMDAAEMIEGVQGRVEPAVADKLSEATTMIYEACSFQDITGQRIGKVVAVLKDIETKVDRLVEVFGSELSERGADGAAARRDRASVAAVGDRPEDADLLDGPQLPEDAKSQEEIDKLFGN